MPPEPQQQHTRVWVAGFIGAVLVAVGAYFLYSRYGTGWGITSYMNKYNAAKVHAVAGDFDAAIAGLLDAVSVAPDKSFEGKSKILLGATYVRRDSSGDKARGTALFKDVVSDPGMPADIRALAYTSIARLVLANDLTFYQLYFPEAPYNSYIPSTGSDLSKINEVYFKILQLSDVTHPNSYAEYLIAGTYYARVGAELMITAPDSSHLKEIASQAQKYIQAGDSKSNTGLYMPSVLLQSYLARAMGIVFSQSILKTSPLEAQEEAYRLVFNTADGFTAADIKSAAVNDVLLRARFFYADFLMRSFPSSRNADIVDLLAPFKDASNPRLLPDTTYARQEAAKLAEISPDFAAYLNATGVAI